LNANANYGRFTLIISSTQTWPTLMTFLSFCLFVCLFLFDSNLMSFCLSFYLFRFVVIFSLFVCLSLLICLFVCLYLFVCSSVCLFVFLSVFVSIRRYSHSLFVILSLFVCLSKWIRRQWLRCSIVRRKQNKKYFPDRLN
jgi:hypothetical protein